VKLYILASYIPKLSTINEDAVWPMTHAKSDTNFAHKHTCARLSKHVFNLEIMEPINSTEYNEVSGKKCFHSEG
jgi:hypothetical protein